MESINELHVSLEQILNELDKCDEQISAISNYRRELAKTKIQIESSIRQVESEIFLKQLKEQTNLDNIVSLTGVEKNLITKIFKHDDGNDLLNSVNIVTYIIQKVIEFKNNYGETMELFDLKHQHTHYKSNKTEYVFKYTFKTQFGHYLSLTD